MRWCCARLYSSMGDVIRAKGLRSVPAVEANGRLLVGNATSAQLADFLLSAATVGQTTGH